MNTRTIHKTAAVILHSLNYGESDRIVTFYTADFGKLTGIAKGARRSKKRFANILEFFSCIQIIFSRRGRDSLALIEEGSVLNCYPRIREDLEKTLIASYLLELMDKFTHEGKKNTELFQLLLSFLVLVEAGNSPEDLLRFFEMRLLKHAGYEPVLDRCMACRRAVGDADVYHFVARDGGLKCMTCEPRHPGVVPVSLGTIKTLLLGKEMEFGKLERLVLSNQVARESRELLAGFIEHIIGKEIKSLHVLQGVREMGI
ncbi:MAG: DNA repair protein RecO [Deltaproteobacteria bacterium]|nr:DNA repair protein RecO [Deltaproteobacteria bacterium]